MTFHNGEVGEVSLWNDEEGFYFDAVRAFHARRAMKTRMLIPFLLSQISWGPETLQQLPIRSLVGLIPLYATLTLEPSTLKKFPGFKKRMEWFIENRPSIWKRNIANMSGACGNASAGRVSYNRSTDGA